MRLLSLVAMGLAGYAIYEMGRMLQAQMGAQETDSSASPARQADQRRARLSGESGEGMDVQVANTDGGTHRQITGRGVISA